MITQMVRYFLIVITTLVCLSAEENDNRPGNQIFHNSSIKDINEYLRVYLPRCTVIDSLDLTSLNSVLYSVDDVNAFDEDDYVIIRDQFTGLFYPLVRHHWPSFNRRLSQELQLMVLKSDSAGHIIEPVNYDFLGLEAFLNNCQILKGRDINPKVLDTIFRFYENEFIRLKEPSQIDKILDRIIVNSGKDKAQFISYVEAKRSVLKEKILRENVYLYSLPYDWQEFIAYFELNPGVSTYCFDVGPDDREYLQENKIFFKPALHGNDFNLVYLWIE